MHKGLISASRQVHNPFAAARHLFLALLPIGVVAQEIGFPWAF